jgi:hypothetical protein
MKIKLPSTGQEIYIGCVHERVEGSKARVTTVWIKDVATDVLLSTASAFCSPKDNFCKRTGRKLAAERLIRAAWAKGVSVKADRRAVMEALCPEFFKAKTR